MYNVIESTRTHRGENVRMRTTSNKFHIVYHDSMQPNEREVKVVMFHFMFAGMFILVLRTLTRSDPNSSWHCLRHCSQSVKSMHKLAWGGGGLGQ
jgi:hypothetical protein